MYNHITYMANCAEKHKQILHSPSNTRFHIINGLAALDQLLQNLQTASEGYHLMASGNLDGAFGYANDTPTDRQMCQFYIIKPEIITDYDAIYQTKINTKAIAAQVVARMLYHQYLANTSPNNPYGLKNLDPRSFSYQSVGPLASGFYGTEVTFDIYNATSLVHDQTKWND